MISNPEKPEEEEGMGILHRHRRPHRAVRAGTLLLLIVLLYGCGGGGSNTTNSTPTPTTTTSTTTTVDGMVSKGPLAGAAITIFTLLPNGQRGSQVAPGTGQPAIVTQADGSWTATIPIGRPRTRSGT